MSQPFRIGISNREILLHVRKEHYILHSQILMLLVSCVSGGVENTVKSIKWLAECR